MGTKKLDAHAVMAPSFIPHKQLSVFLRPPDNIWLTQLLPSDNGHAKAQALFHASVKAPPSCLCRQDNQHHQRYPWESLPRLMYSQDFAIGPTAQQRKSPTFRRDFLNIETDIHSLKEYTQVFQNLLQEEYEETTMLYDQYSQYNQLVVATIDHKSGISRAVLAIPGIYDARPPLSTGDLVILRPLEPVYGQFHEIRATVANTIRAVHYNDTDKVVITWVPDHQSRIVQGLPMAVRFVPITTHFDRCLAALNWLETYLDINAAKELLFPSRHPKIDASHKQIASLLAGIRAQHPELEILNKQQRQFVTMVLSRSAFPTMDFVRPPMILTGPAGTGKTSALLSAIVKCLLLDAGNRILVCTPSHTACDVLTRRLSKYLAAHQLFRLYDSSRPVEMIPVDMLAFTKQASTGEFVLPTIQDLRKQRVLVCTCSDTHLLFLSGITNASLRIRRQCLQTYIETTVCDSGMTANIQGATVPHFTHLFIDEAAQASEPETLIPLSVVVDDMIGIPKVEIALCGDPRQLNPDVYSRFASPGLQKSFLERLLRLPDFGGRRHLMGPPTNNTWRTLDELIEYSFQRDDEDDDDNNDNCGTKDMDNTVEFQNLSVFLTQSYRGHPSFLTVPSKLFYLNKLKSVHADDTEDATWCSALRKLEGKSTLTYPTLDKKYSWPIHYLGVVGRDTSMAVKYVCGSNSWCNQDEAKAVADIVYTLCSNGIDTRSIGVMAAFRAQVLQIRKLLRKQNLNAVNVGMVEDYQAVERKVIVLSLTRSNPSLVPMDIERNAGLFQQPKRMNVALTRAENLLIVVGNPATMKMDPMWSLFLDYCREHGFWYGAAVPEGARNLPTTTTPIPTLSTIPPNGLC